jgi:hypothetical protein
LVVVVDIRAGCGQAPDAPTLCSQLQLQVRIVAL